VRSIESPAWCSETEWSIAWARTDDEQRPFLGRLTCRAAECKATESTWPSLGVKAWVGVAPIGEVKVGAVYRTLLGDLRARVGSAADISTGLETLITDDEEHGGRAVGQAVSIASGSALVMLFSSATGLHALRVGDDGSVRPLPARELEGT
jgi:hypothetical protein